LGILLFLIFYNASVVAEIGFKTDGYIVQDQFDPTSGLLNRSDRIDFSVVVRAAAYKINTRKLTNLQQGEIAETLTGSDGTNCFEILFHSDTNNTVWLETGYFPRGTVPHESLLWLAYCSGYYLNSSSSNVCPVQDEYILNDYDVSEVSFAVIQIPDSPHLPSAVDVSSPNYAPRKSQANSKKMPLKPPFDHGYRLCHFEVTSTQSKGELTIPTEFTFESYRPKPEAASQQDLLLKCRLRFVATNVSVDVGIEDLAMEFSRPLTVYDFRFLEKTKGGSLSYVVTNSPVLSKDDTVVLQALNQKLAEINKLFPPSRRRGKSIFLLFALVVALPVLIPVFVSMKRYWKQKPSIIEERSSENESP